MKRRAFLKLIAIGPIVGTASLAQEVVPKPPQRLVLTIEGINEGTNVEALGALLAALIVAVVPINLVVEGPKIPDAALQNSPIWPLLARYQESFPGLVEIVVWCPDLGQLAPFEAARKAHEARKRLTRVLYVGRGAAFRHRPLVSIACNAPLDSNAASASLASGFRNLLELPSASTTVTARLDRQGVLSLLGGERRHIQEIPGELARDVPGLQRNLILSAADLSLMASHELFESAQEIGSILKEASLGLRMISVLVSDVQMRSEVEFRRRVSILLLVPEDTASTQAEGLGALKELLRNEAIPFNVARASSLTDHAELDDLTFWIPLGGPKNDDFNPDAVYATFSGEDLTPARVGAVSERDMRYGVVARPVREEGNLGVTSKAELNIHVLSVVGLPEGGALGDFYSVEVRTDGLVLVSVPGIQEDSERHAILKALKALARRPEVRLIPLQAYCAETLPKDELLPALLLTAAGSLRKKTVPITASSQERQALIDDAQAAWAYFAQTTEIGTGLCAATAVVNGQLRAGHAAVSMWEIGSHINALIAAVDLDLISDEDFSARCKLLLRTVERASRKRLVLPAETIDVYSGKGTTRFNSYDTGRLLIAMHRLRKHRLAPLGLDELVQSWDFKSVIKDRRLHSYRDRQLIDDFASNYADYAATGMRLWGIDVASPLDALETLLDADRAMALLTSSVSFGPLASEPSFLHLLETSGSSDATYLSDCLDAIQSRLAEETGRPAAPSETPLDREPWFTYQGFDLRKLSDPWVVEFGGKGRADDAGPTETSLRASSSKGAYLWLALHPNRYSRELVSTVRLRARSKYGFFSAVYFEDHSPTEGYLDLNTNAIILQSIAFILGSDT